MLHRRNFFRTLGTAALALPALSGLPRSLSAQPITAPKRLVIWFTPNGVPFDRWFPTAGATERDFTLSDMLSPLERHRERLLVLGAREWDPRYVRNERGISIKCVPETPSGGHQLGMLLTGAPMATYDGVELGSAPSIDQIVARAIGDQTRFPSLELGARVGGNEGQGKRLVYRDAGQWIPAVDRPEQVWDRVFASLVGSPDERERDLARRRGVVDFLHGRYASLRTRLDAGDRATLDAHVTALREVEGRLTAPLNACEVPGRPDIAPRRWDDYTDLPDLIEAQCDLLALAFACDQTRVATVQITEAASNARYPFLTGTEEWHHALSHDNSPESVDKLAQIGAWHAERLSGFLDRLAAIPDVDGRTVLDNTIVFWANEMADGVYHTHQNMPFVLAGGGGLRTGRYLQLDDASHNDLLLALVNLMGVDVDYVGAPEYCTGPLGGLT